MLHLQSAAVKPDDFSSIVGSHRLSGRNFGTKFIIFKLKEFSKNKKLDK